MIVFIVAYLFIVRNLVKIWDPLKARYKKEKCTTRINLTHWPFLPFTQNIFRQPHGPVSYIRTGYVLLQKLFLYGIYRLRIEWKMIANHILVLINPQQ